MRKTNRDDCLVQKESFSVYVSERDISLTPVVYHIQSKYDASHYFHNLIYCVFFLFSKIHL